MIFNVFFCIIDMYLILFWKTFGPIQNKSNYNKYIMYV